MLPSGWLLLPAPLSLPKRSLLLLLPPQFLPPRRRLARLARLAPPQFLGRFPLAPPHFRLASRHRALLLVNVIHLIHEQVRLRQHGHTLEQHNFQ